jgi:hypothetical protein
LEKMGKRVWGTRNAEELEIYREVCKEQMEELGLAVQPWKIVKGVSALEAHLKAHKDQHVKIDRWRGVTETFFSPSWEIVEPKVHAIADTLGGFKEDLEFIVEDDLPDRVEVGLDTYCIDGVWPVNTLFGIECKDCGYIGQMVKWKDIPEPLRRWSETAERVAATTRTSEKTATLAGYLASLDAAELPIAAVFLQIVAAVKPVLEAVGGQLARVFMAGFAVTKQVVEDVLPVLQLFIDFVGQMMAVCQPFNQFVSAWIVARFLVVTGKPAA